MSTNKDKSDTQSYGTRRVIRGPANDKIGFSPIPDVI